MIRPALRGRGRAVAGVDGPPALSSAGGAPPHRQRSSWDAALLWMALLLMIMQASYFVYYFQILKLPKPMPAALSGKRGFSEELAYQHVKVLSNLGPHPVGSPALEEAMKYVLLKAEEIQAEASLGVDFDMDFFYTRGVNELVGGLFKGKSLVYTNLVQLAVRVKSASAPKAEENAVLVSSHVDTVITSPGAGDCSSNVAVMLELLRALSHWGHGFRHSVIFLFNTGEEEGLDGAHGFITQHPWRSSIRTFIDLEAMGVGGKSILFQAGPNKAIVELYAKVVKHPAAQIAAQDVFLSGFVKSATDFQVYTEIGNLSGLDFAFMQNGAVYHTKNDKLQFLTPGSLQHVGDNMLALLRELAVSDELPSLSVSSGDGEKSTTGIVYFDILGKFQVTYSQTFAKQLYGSVVTQSLLLLFVSLLQGGFVSIKALTLASISLIFTWLLSMSVSALVGYILPRLSYAAIPYIPYPWLTVGLFGAPALFGALLGHHLGFTMLKAYLLKAQKTRYAMLSGSLEENCQNLAVCDAQRWLFKAGFLQWLVLLAVGAWFEVGSSYIALAWLISPALAYGLIDATFSPQRVPRELRVITLLAAVAAPLISTGGTVIHLFDVMVGILVRLDRNPGMSPDWLGNILIAALAAAIVCLFLVYLLPYACHSGALKLILSWLILIFVITLVVISLGILPPFTKHFGRALNVVQVVEVGTSDDGGRSSLSSYVLLSSVTPGKLTQESLFLEGEGFFCGDTKGIDMVTHIVKYGCTSVTDQQGSIGSYLTSIPTIIATDKVVNQDASASFIIRTASALRWVLAMNTTQLLSYQLEEISPLGIKRTIASRRNASAVDGWHTIQFVSESGPLEFELTLFWSDAASLETILNEKKYTLLKLRTDVNKITPKVERTLQKLPDWAILFGKSTAPYPLSYLVKFPPASPLFPTVAISELPPRMLQAAS